MHIVTIIPTYNERENIDKLLNLLTKFKFSKGDRHTILVVDDNSPDGTGKIVAAWNKKDKRVRLLSGPKEGLGKAMVRGYRYALDKLNPDVIVTNEADFGFDFSHLPMMIGKIKEGYDVVVASRHVGEGRSDGWTATRKLNHFIANTVFARWIAGVTNVHDKNGAFRAIRVRGVLDKINFDNFPTKGFSFFYYFIYRLSRVTHKFYEFPCVFTFRTVGESKVSFNSKYISTYLHDILEYIILSFRIRLESFIMPN